MKVNLVCRGTKALSIGLIALAYIFARPFVASSGGAASGLTSVIALQRPTDSPSETASGTVTIRKTAASQEFGVDVRKIIPAANTPVGGLGVYLSQLPFDTNSFYFVNVLDGSTNGHWRLDLNTSPAAPPQLAVADVTNLFGRIVRIADTATNIYLETIIPPFVSSPAALSYKQRVKLTRPGNSPSPDATGQIIIKLDGVHGTSLFDVRAKKLATGNGYCSWVLAFFGQPTGPCDGTTNLVRNTARFSGDTRKGEQLLKGALSNGVVRVDQLSGSVVEIRDVFGVTHLQGQIP